MINTNNTYINDNFPIHHAHKQPYISMFNSNNTYIK